MYQKRHVLAHNALELYQKAYSEFIEQFNYQPKKQAEYPLDMSVLIENSTVIKKKRVILKYSRIHYIEKQFKQSLNHLLALFIQRHKDTNKMISESMFCIRASNDVLQKKIHQEQMNVDELDAQKIVAAYQIYNILNEE